MTNSLEKIKDENETKKKANNKVISNQVALVNQADKYLDID